MHYLLNAKCHLHKKMVNCDSSILSHRSYTIISVLCSCTLPTSIFSRYCPANIFRDVMNLIRAPIQLYCLRGYLLNPIFTQGLRTQE